MFRYSRNSVPGELLTVGSVNTETKIPYDQTIGLLPALEAKYGRPGQEIIILRPVPLTKEQYDNFVDHYLPVDGF